MGQLVDGRWRTESGFASGDGDFKRAHATFRSWVTPDGRAGPSGESGFAAEPGRYHLYVGYACPWAHRTLIYRALKGLEPLIDVSVVHWHMGESGWTFEADEEGIVGDRLSKRAFLHQVYTDAAPDATTRVTIPILWDKRQGAIVSNESADIIRMFDSAFDQVGATPGDHYPPEQRDAIDAWNTRVYDTLNNGVYRAGFATTQAAYEAAVTPLFDTLDALEAHLSTSRFLTGDAPLEADWRLLPTLLRFDAVYHGHFKCNRRKLAEYPALTGYTRELYQWPGIAGTCRFDHAVRHYYTSHESVNPTRIVPIGPPLTFDRPHGRESV